MSDTSEKSADLRSLAGSHNFASASSNVESVFGSTSGSAGSFSVSSSIRSPGRGLSHNFRSTKMSTGTAEMKYMTRDELTPL